MRTGARSRDKESEQFFFEKKNQKTFIRLLRTLPGVGEANGENVFASFFKKKRFLSLLSERSMFPMVGIARQKRLMPTAVGMG